MNNKENKCSKHPDAPHGFLRDASHAADRYVCECEGWEPPTQVTRLEIIDADGRSYTNWKVKDLEFSYQDDGRTLKIFIK